MLLLVGPPERSIARNNIPSSPAGLIPPPPSWPPRLTAVLRSKVGVWLPIWALLDRSQKNPLFPSPPLQLMPSSDWYWQPCPGPADVSLVNHSLSPPPPPLTPDSSVQD